MKWVDSVSEFFSVYGCWGVGGVGGGGAFLPNFQE